MKSHFSAIIKTVLILVYLVIIAGAVVRMTGSGMGCPDWPRCFGHYIPPVSEEELLWRPNTDFSSGQVIIRDTTLLVATTDFRTSNTFNPRNWERYTKHNYAVFNVYHTWTEYINRLMGALAGLGTLFMAFVSLSFWKERKKIVWLSWFIVFLMGFQAWLGAKVVYSVLEPAKITLHMVVALFIVAVILYLLNEFKIVNKNREFKRDSLFRKVLRIAVLCTLIQVVLGTEVRQFIDERTDALGYDDPQLWLQNPSVSFYIHRSFSFFVLLVNVFLYLRNRKMRLGFRRTTWILVFIAVEIVSGVFMSYFDFPFGTQATHLVFAALLFGLQFYLLLQSRIKHAYY